MAGKDRELVKSEEYHGLDPLDVEEARQRATQPREYVRLRDNVEDLIYKVVPLRNADTKLLLDAMYAKCSLLYHCRSFDL